MPGTTAVVRRSALSLALLIILLSACSLPIGKAPEPTVEATLPAPTPAATAVAPRTLTICLGEEPNTLYPFASPNEAAQSVLAAIDDGPIDTISYDYQPVILQKMPTLADGDAQIMPADVKAGAKIVDADGKLTALTAGARVRPSSCRTDDCVITYD